MIEHFIITVLVIYGIHASTRSGMVLVGIRRLINTLLYPKGYNCDHIDSFRSNVAYNITKILFDCTPCMASLYGTISFFFVGCFPTPLFFSWAVWVFSLCGFNFLLNKILNR